MKTLTNLQNGNRVTQRNAFLIAFAIGMIALAVLHFTHVINLLAK